MKKLVAAVVLMILSVNMFVLIPWEVVLYRGEYVHIIQSPGKTERILYPREPVKYPADGITTPYIKPDVDALVSVLLSNADARSNAGGSGGIEAQVRLQLPRLDKLYVPDLPGEAVRVESVALSKTGFKYDLADNTGTYFKKCELVIGCQEDCEICNGLAASYQNMQEKGDTDRYLELDGIKALSASKLQAFGTIKGVRFHAIFNREENTLDRELLSKMDFKPYYPSHSALIPYRLAEAGRILSVALFVTGSVLLILGLLPLRKKQTIPDG